MYENVQFYPEPKTVEVDPLSGSAELRYVLEGFPRELSGSELKIKYAFPAKLEIDPPQAKETIKRLLISIINVNRLQVNFERDNVLEIIVPLAAVEDADSLPDKGIVTVKMLVKLVVVGDSEAQFKCLHEIALDTDSSEDSEEREAGEEESEEGEGEESEEEEENAADFYSGLIAVDYGTSNSSVAVRDPMFASEEVRGQLGSEQWQSLCEWINLWLTKHLTPIEPQQIDVFVQSLGGVIPEAEIPECGSPRQEILQGLQGLGDKARAQLLTELLGRLSSYSRQGTDEQMMKSLAAEVMEGLEAVIDSNNLESQRYFVLELDKNIGPGPISSVLQVMEAPHTEDPEQLKNETKVDMGARVGLLLHSAAIGEIDIRQFVLSSKRYFGRDETIPIVPAEGGGEEIQFPADILAHLTYKELFNRCVQDIHRRSEQGQFQDAQWARTVVATFPTSYPASLRKMIREMLEELDIKEIDTRFDEATGAAIYYIWREIGADPVCGMHGLMARSRKDKYNRSYQNILLYDLGGGTTDIALIQLLYEEVEVFEPEDDRGNGGCYFRITPRLLGTTGHRYLGGDLLTLWLFRYMKSKLADILLTRIAEKNLEPPIDSPLSQMLMDLPEELVTEESEDGDFPRYRPGALLEWTTNPSHMQAQYNKLNEKVIDAIIPTRFINDSSKVPNFFTLWEITDELKKTLGTPIIEHFGTCLGQGLADNWPDQADVDPGQLLNFISMAQPWIVEGGHISEDDLHIIINQEDMNQVVFDTVEQSISLAASLGKARLHTRAKDDRVDRLILSGLSCNMKVVQDAAEKVFRESDGIFDYDPVNVRFDRDSAKTAVSLGACIGRYMESVRVDPYNDKTRQLLRDGYDQIELVIENLFCYLPCRIAYDSLVAMVPIFEQGDELNVKSYWDKKSVARTSLKALRPVQEKFWIYRIDFVGAEPQYLGLINAESVSREHSFEDFRKFREDYVVGFEADAELFVRAFFLPKGQNKIVAKSYREATEGGLLPEIIREATPEELEQYQDTEGEEQPPFTHVLARTIMVKEVLDDVPVILEGEPLNYAIEYPDGATKACCISEALHIRKELEFILEDEEAFEDAVQTRDEKVVAKFELDEDETNEATLVCDEDGKLIVLTECLFDIEIFAEIEYEAQKIDLNYDPFCGCH